MNDEAHETFENEISFSNGKHSLTLLCKKGHRVSTKYEQSESE